MGLSTRDLLKELNKYDDELYVIFDFGAHPIYIDSWRGSYELPSLFWDTKCLSIKNKDFKDMLEDVNGMEVEGYKGDSFILDDTDTIWLSGYDGDYTLCTISGVTKDSIYLILNTQYEVY